MVDACEEIGGRVPGSGNRGPFLNRRGGGGVSSRFSTERQGYLSKGQVSAGDDKQRGVGLQISPQPPHICEHVPGNTRMRR